MSGVFAIAPSADHPGNLKSHLVFMKQIELWPRVYDIRGDDTDHEFVQFIQLLISQPVFISQDITNVIRGWFSVNCQIVGSNVSLLLNYYPPF